MKRFIWTVFAVQLSLSASARVIEEEKRQLIDQMIVLSGAQQVTDVMADALTVQLFSSLKQKNPDLDQAVFDIIRQESKTIIYEEYTLSNLLNEIFYALYDEQFSTQDLEQMVAFFSTEVGKQTLSVLPQIAKQSREQVKAHAQEIGPKAQRRIMERLKAVSETLKNAEPKAD